MFKRSWQSVAAILLFGGVVFSAFSQKQPPAGHSSGTQPETSEALQFLGSYSAPSAVEATETGHTSAHPPSAPADRRLRRIEAGPGILSPWAADLAWNVKSIQEACGKNFAVTELATQSSTRPAKSRPADFESFGQEMLSADRALRRSHFAEAVASYDHVLRQQPRCPPVVWNRALAEAYARFPAALPDLFKAFPDAPSPAVGHLLLGLVRLGGGDLEGARSDLLACFRERDQSGAKGEPSKPGLGPSESDFLWGRAILAWSSGETIEARQGLSRLLDIDPKSAEVWFFMGGVALEEARANSRRLAELAPESVWNRRLEGEALEARYPALARKLLPEGLSKVESTSGDFTAAYPATSAGGTAYSEPAPAVTAPDSGEEERELQHLEALPDSPQVLYLRARAALHFCELAYDRALSSSLLNAQLHALRALAAEQEDDEAAALSEYRAGLLQNPRSPILHAGLGHIYRQRLELDSARRELAEAFRLDPSDPTVAFELGDVYQRLGQPARAIPLLNQALQIDSGLVVARWSRAKAYLASGDSQRALAELEAAAPADTSGELQWQLAQLYQKLGRSDLASQAQQRSEEQRRAAAARNLKGIGRNP